MRAIYICTDDKCAKTKEVNSIGNQAHFKRCKCECGKSMKFKEMVKDDNV